MGKKKPTIVFRVEISMLLGSDGKISGGKMDRLVMAIANMRNSGKHVLIVSSGAIVLGSEKLKQDSLPVTQLGMQAAAAIGQTELIRCYQSYFDEYNQIIAQVLITSDIINYKQRMENTGNTFDALLDMNIIPVINENDPVSVSDIELGDNYPLALIVAGITGADFIIVAEETEGEYLIIPGDNSPAIEVFGEEALQAGIDSVYNEMISHTTSSWQGFPKTINEISPVAKNTGNDE